MLADHAIHFSIEIAMMKRWELMIHKRKVMIYLRPPLANMFRIEAESGSLIGSNASAKGLKTMNKYITTDWTALDTILQLVEYSSTAVAPSWMHPSAPHLRCGSILTSAYSSTPNLTS